jgi:hypothetical protein
MPQPPPLPPPPPKILTGIGCASCGGSVEIREGWTNTHCRYCGTGLALVGERGVDHLMVLNRIEQSAASTTVRRWLGAGIRKDPALKREAHLSEVFLAWFPFVRGRFDLVGWALGFERHRVKKGDRWVTEERPVERQMERPVDETLAAAEMAEFGVARVNLAGDEIQALDEEELRSRGMMFRPTRSPQQSADELANQAIARAQQEVSIDRVTFSWLTAVRRRVSVVYYPLWVFRYGFRGRTYQVLVDAEDGVVAYGKAPGNHLYRACCVVAAAAGACFLGTTVLRHIGWFLRGDQGIVFLGLVGVGLAGLLHWGYSQFRHGGVLEEGTGIVRRSKDSDLGASIKGVMEKLQ